MLIKIFLETEWTFSNISATFAHFKYVHIYQLHPSDLPLLGNRGLCSKPCPRPSDRTAGEQNRANMPPMWDIWFNSHIGFIQYRSTKPFWSPFFWHVSKYYAGNMANALVFLRLVGRPCYPGHLSSDKLLHLPWRNQGCHMDQCLSGEIVKIGQILFDPKRRYACWSPPLWWSSLAKRWLVGQASSSGVLTLSSSLLSMSHIVSNSIQVIEITIRHHCDHFIIP